MQSTYYGAYKSFFNPCILYAWTRYDHTTAEESKQKPLFSFKEPFFYTLFLSSIDCRESISVTYWCFFCLQIK